MSSGASVKLLIRTAPWTPCAAVTTPRHTSLVVSDIVFARNAPAVSAPASGRTRRLGGGLGAFLRTRLWLRLDRVVGERRLFDQTGVAEKARYAIGRKSTHPEPMLDPLGFERHPIGVVAVEHRIVGSKLLDEPPVARTVRV